MLLLYNINTYLSIVLGITFFNTPLLNLNTHQNTQSVLCMINITEAKNDAKKIKKCHPYYKMNIKPTLTAKKGAVIRTAP